MAEALAYIDQPGGDPAQYQFPPGHAVEIEAVSAHVDGTSAASSFVPCLAFYSQDGKLIGRWPVSQTLIAGDSAEVSFGPFAGGTGSNIPVPAGGQVVIELDYVERTSNLTVTSTTPAAPDDFITGNAVTVDGASEITIEVFIPIGQVGDATGTATVRVQIWDGTTSLGVACHLGDAFTNTSIAAAMFGSVRYTPTAGTHTWSAKAYMSGTTAVLLCGDLIYQPDKTLPAYLRVTSLVT